MLLFCFLSEGGQSSITTAVALVIISLGFAKMQEALQLFIFIFIYFCGGPMFGSVFLNEGDISDATLCKEKKIDINQNVLRCWQ